MPSWLAVIVEEFFENCFDPAGFTDNSSVSVISTPDQKELYTMTESVAGTYRADLGNLATLGPVRFNDKLKGLLTTAHPTLMEDGTLVNLLNGVRLSSHGGTSALHSLLYPI